MCRWSAHYCGWLHLWRSVGQLFLSKLSCITGFLPRSLTFFSSKWNRIGWNYTSQRRSFCGHTKCFTKQIASAEFIAQIVKSILVASESWNNVGGKKAYEWTAYMINSIETSKTEQTCFNKIIFRIIICSNKSEGRCNWELKFNIGFATAFQTHKQNLISNSLYQNVEIAFDNAWVTLWWWWWSLPHSLNLSI